MGDDKQKARFLGNLGNLCTLHGQPEDGAALAEEARELSRYSTANPVHSYSVYTNLADAYLLLGHQEKAETCFEELKRHVVVNPSWYLNVGFLAECACLALALGNEGLALHQIASLETLVRGRKRGLPNRGVYEKLRVYRIAKLGDPKQALEVATDAVSEFRGKHHIHYLDAIVAKSWVEELSFGATTDETTKELALLDSLGAIGKKRLMTLQGFLKEGNPGSKPENCSGAAASFPLTSGARLRSWPTLGNGSTRVQRASDRTDA